MRTASIIAIACLLAFTATASIRESTSQWIKHLNVDANTLQLAQATDAPTTVSSLNVTAFCGRWYEVYQDLITAATFQQDSFCATATYEPIGDGRVSVSNREHYGNITGPQRNVSGYAYQPNATAEPGQLLVFLHGQNSSPFPAPYWILRTGPILFDGKYDFAIVSDPFRLTLFVLCRDVRRFHEKHEADVLAWLKSNGFDKFWNEPIALQQEGCTYF